MKTNKNDIIAARNERTGQSYKHQALYVGDVWENAFKVRSIVTFKLNEDGTKKYLFCKVNGAEHGLPEDRAGFNDGTYEGNVCDDEALMQEFIANGLIVDEVQAPIPPAPPTPPVIEEVVAEVTAEVEPEPVKEEKPKTTRKRATKKETTAEITAEVEPKPIKEEVVCKCNNKISLLSKINNIRAAWSKTNVEKAGLGRAGGNSKYQYYKPQQIIDFCLKEEIKQGIFSEFDTTRNDGGQTVSCYYKVVDIDTGECRVVSCPFDVPRKMACSEAQQVGAALTYYNRRLAMLMYKIEDNSRESVEVLDDADYTAQTVPTIPAPPIAEMPSIPAPPQNIKIEPPTSPNTASEIKEDKIVPPPTENTKSVNLPWENEQKTVVPEPPKTEILKVDIPQAVPQGLPPAPPAVEHVVPQTPVPSAPKAPNIEDLY